jgi:hypothetical protein
MNKFEQLQNEYKKQSSEIKCGFVKFILNDFLENNNNISDIITDLPEKTKQQFTRVLLDDVFQKELMSLGEINQLHKESHHVNGVHSILYDLQSEFEELQYISSQLGKGIYEPYYFDNSSYMEQIKNVCFTEEERENIYDACNDIIDEYNSLLTDNYDEKGIQGIHTFMDQVDTQTIKP